MANISLMPVISSAQNSIKIIEAELSSFIILASATASRVSIIHVEADGPSMHKRCIAAENGRITLLVIALSIIRKPPATWPNRPLDT